MVGILHRIAPEFVQFVGGLLVCLFGLYAYNTSVIDAIKMIGWIVFPIRDKVYVVVQDKPKQKRIEPGERDSVVNDPRTIPKPSEPTPEELREWQAFDAKKLNGPSVKMTDLPDMFPDEEPF